MQNARHWFWYLLALLLPFSLPGLVLAQDTTLGESPPAKSYVFGYFLTFLGIVLGLLVVCRPGKRSKEVK